MILKSDTKFEEEPDCHCKNDMRNLVNFHLGTWESQNLHFDGLLISKVYKVSAKKLQRSYLSWHWTVMQNFKTNLLAVAKLHHKFDEFLREQSKVSKFGLSSGTYVQSV